MANRTAATGIVAVGSLGKPASARSAGVAGWTESDDRGVEPGDRARSREVRGGATTDDASGCGCADRTGFRSDYRRYGTLSVREASGELSRIGAAGKVQRESATAGPHHQTRKFAVGHPAALHGESELVITIGVATEETNGSDRVPDLKRLRCEPLVGTALFSTRAKWRSSLSACCSVLETS